MALDSSSFHPSIWTGEQIDEVIGFFHNNSNLITKTLPEMEDKVARLESRISSVDGNISNNISPKFNDYLRLAGGDMEDSAVIRGKVAGGLNYSGANSAAFIQVIPTSTFTEMRGEYIPVFSVYSKVGSQNTVQESFSCGATKNNTLSFRHLKNGVSTEMFYGTPEGILMGAAWNDYAEFRKSDEQEPGRVICENGDGSLSRSYKRLQPGAEIISDTFGFAIGKTDECQTPVAVTGRVLAHTYENWWTFEPGEPVCAGPDGTVSKMTREEVKEYPERIIGTVSELPTYEFWGEKQVPVNNRIWIRIK